MLLRLLLSHQCLLLLLFKWISTSRWYFNIFSLWMLHCNLIIIAFKWVCMRSIGLSLVWLLVGILSLITTYILIIICSTENRSSLADSLPCNTLTKHWKMLFVWTFSICNHLIVLIISILCKSISVCWASSIDDNIICVNELVCWYLTKNITFRILLLLLLL